MEIDGKRLAEALGRPEPLVVHTELCRSQIAAFEAGLAPGAAVHVACTQEAPLFREVAAEKGEARPTSPSPTSASAPAGARTSPPPCRRWRRCWPRRRTTSKPTGVTTLKSEGVCLVYGRGQAALDVAAELSDRLSVTVLLSDPEEALPPGIVSVPIYKGRIRTATGHLGRFEIEVDGYAPMLPSSKGALQFVMPRDGARSTCDIIFDMSGGTPLFADAQRRDGYLHVDPSHPAAVARAMFKVTDLVGEFEKPLYVSYDAGICAHARSQKVGCTNCLDNCPTGAITPNGDHVAIDAALCGGCGNCSAVCPTGAVSYAYPAARRSGGASGRAAQGLPRRRRHAARRAVPRREARQPPDRRHGPAGQGAAAQRAAAVALLRAAARATTRWPRRSPSAPSRSSCWRRPSTRPSLPRWRARSRLTAAFLDGLGYRGPRLHLSSERDPDAVEALLYGLAGAADRRAGGLHRHRLQARHRPHRAGQAQGRRAGAQGHHRAARRLALRPPPGRRGRLHALPRLRRRLPGGCALRQP